MVSKGLGLFSTQDPAQATDMQQWWCTLDNDVHSSVSLTEEGSCILYSLRKLSYFPSSWQSPSGKLSSKALGYSRATL